MKSLYRHKRTGNIFIFEKDDAQAGTTERRKARERIAPSAAGRKFVKIFCRSF